MTDVALKRPFFSNSKVGGIQILVECDSLCISRGQKRPTMHFYKTHFIKMHFVRLYFTEFEHRQQISRFHIWSSSEAFVKKFQHKNFQDRPPSAKTSAALGHSSAAFDPTRPSNSLNVI